MSRTSWHTAKGVWRFMKRTLLELFTNMTVPNTWELVVPLKYLHQLSNTMVLSKNCTIFYLSATGSTDPWAPALIALLFTAFAASGFCHCVVWLLSLMCHSNEFLKYISQAFALPTAFDTTSSLCHHCLAIAANTTCTCAFALLLVVCYELIEHLLDS